MARAGELLDLGDRTGARRIVRRVLDQADPELLGELADLSTDLGLGEEDLGPAVWLRAEIIWRPPGGSAVRISPLPAPGSRSSRARAAPGRRGLASTVAATAGTRRRPTPLPGRLRRVGR